MNEDLSNEELVDDIQGEVQDTSSNLSSRSKPSKSIKQRAADVTKGAGTAVDATGKTVNATGKGVSAAGKTTEAAGKGIQATGKATEAAGKGVQAAGKGMQAAGKGASAAGSGMMEAGAALSSTGVGAIAGVPLAVLGGAAKAAGTATDVAGKGTEVAGKGAESAGKGMQQAGKGVEKAGKGIDKSGKKIQDTGKGISSTGKRIKDAGSKAGGTDSKAQQISDNIGSKVADKAKKNLKEKLNPLNKDNSVQAKLSLKGMLKSVKKFFLIYITIILLNIIVISLIIETIFGPLVEAMQWMDENWNAIADKSEKYNNMYTGFGYQTTKAAFYDELNYLYDEYDQQLDIPLLMAALFYKEKEGYNTSFGSDPLSDKGDLDELNTSSLKQQALSYLKGKYKDLYEDLDADGKNYTIGKIYRLRKLARNQLDTSLFGNGGLPTSEEEITLSEFIERTKDRLGSDVYQAFQAAPSGLESLNPLNWVKHLYELMSIADGSETWSTTSFGNDNEATLALGNLLKELVLTGQSIASIQWSLTDLDFVVKIYKYDYNEDNFKKYLKDYYIPNMPEFQENIAGLNDAAKEKEIDYIIKDIYEYAKEFREIYGYEEESSENTNDECVGNIDSNIVDKLGLPIKTSSEFNFSGEYAYGITNGIINNGLDLNSYTSGVNEGDEVYSIADGTVVESVSKLTCNKGSDSNCASEGNYVKIKHTIKVDSNTYKITSIYMNLQANSGQPKKGSTVKKGQVIGKVGKTGDVSDAQVHFEIHDVSDNNNEALNPTNLFIACSNIDSDVLTGSTDIEKIWIYLINKGYSKVSAASIMGNLQAESGLVSIRKQGDYVKPYKISQSYTNSVDKGNIKKSTFVHDSVGYGLAQWTFYTRKQSLYDTAKKKKTSIGDLKMQLDFLDKEIKSWTDYKSWSKMTDLVEATNKFCYGFERPGTPHIEQRQSHAKEIYKQYKNANLNPSNANMDNLASDGGTYSTTNSKGKTNSQKIKVVFPNGVPTSEKELKKYLTTITVPITTDKGKKTTTTVTVHKAIAGDVQAALKAAQKEGFRVYEIGGYREFGKDSAGKVRDVGLVYSQHCYGLAVDINAKQNCYKSPATAACSVGDLYSTSNQYSIKKTGALYKSFISNGWGWGGDWHSLKDYMHFSYFGT